MSLDFACAVLQSQGGASFSWTRGYRCRKELQTPDPNRGPRRKLGSPLESRWVFASAVQPRFAAWSPSSIMVSVSETSKSNDDIERSCIPVLSIRVEPPNGGVSRPLLQVMIMIMKSRCQERSGNSNQDCYRLMVMSAHDSWRGRLFGFNIRHPGKKTQSQGRERMKEIGDHRKCG